MTVPRTLVPLGPYAPAMVLSVVLLALEAGADLMQPTLMARLVNQGVLGRDEGALTLWGAWMLAFVVLGALCALGRNALSSLVSQRYGAALREKTFGHVLGLRYDQARAHEPAAILTRLTYDVTQVQNLLNGLMRLYLKAPLLGLGALVLAFSTDPLLGLLILPVFPLVTFLFARQLKVTLPLFQRSQALLDGLNARVRDFLHGVRVIKGFGRQAQERDRFDASNAGLTEVTTATQVIQAAFSPLVTLTVSLTVVLVLAVGGLVRGPGSGTVGHLMAFVQYLTQILFSLIVVSNLVGVFSRARTSAGRIAGLLEVAPRPRPPVSPAPREAGTLATFEGVEYSYGGDPVLSGVSFTLGPGQTLGLLGSTGSGKTTVLHLLMGFLEPTAGWVTVSPGPVGYVSQRAQLFSGTLRENLLWGDPNAPADLLEEVLEVADAWEFIRRFPEGLDTRLGPGGVNLSGGQRQRVTLARALVGRPQLILLDEAFSALDQDTEARIEARLGRFLPGAARVLVAQKVASVARCTQVLVLEDGRVDGLGTPGDLARSSAVYRQICRSQGVEP